MSDITLSLSDGMWAAIQTHLFPRQAKFEEAAFVFATVERTQLSINLAAVEWYPVPPEDFDEQSPCFLQLTDQVKARIIKCAHDLQATFVEVHSHPFQNVAEFSASDLSGFSEFVPHVRWRLRRQPYVAIVVARNTFDALAWASENSDASPLTAVIADGLRYYPTGATLAEGFHESW